MLIRAMALTACAALMLSLGAPAAPSASAIVDATAQRYFAHELATNLEMRLELGRPITGAEKQAVETRSRGFRTNNRCDQNNLFGLHERLSPVATTRIVSSYCAD